MLTFLNKKLGGFWALACVIYRALGSGFSKNCQNSSMCIMAVGIVRFSCYHLEAVAHYADYKQTYNEEVEVSRALISCNKKNAKEMDSIVLK